MSCKKECISRRKFLESVGAIGGALALSSPLVAALTGCSQQGLSSPLGQGSSSVNVANNPDNIYTFDFTNYPALQNPGGSIQATIQATSGTKTVFITRVDANTVETVSTICTHAGCTLSAYNSSSEQYACPCHGSVFAADGAVVTGPAVTPLPSYASVLSGTGVQVTVA